MYVAKICRRGLVVDARIFEKIWSEELASNKVIDINKKSFILRRRAEAWVNKEICKSMFQSKRLEIIDE